MGLRTWERVNFRTDLNLVSREFMGSGTELGKSGVSYWLRVETGELSSWSRVLVVGGVC